MQELPPVSKEEKSISRWWYFAWGLLAGLILATLVAVGILVLRHPLASLVKNQADNPTPDACVEVEVDKDGCGVVRGEVRGDSIVSGLTWVVKDDDGYAVLERNAENEYRYRYFEAGHYFVHIDAWYDGRYHQISNEVEIDC